MYMMLKIVSKILEFLIVGATSSPLDSLAAGISKFAVVLCNCDVSICCVIQGMLVMF